LKYLAAYLRGLWLPTLPPEQSGSVGQMELQLSTQNRE